MKKYSQTQALAAASRWLVALGRPDADAWARAEEARDELDSTDPVRLAIDYCLEPETPERKARANAALAYTAERARSEPYAFDRVMVERTGRFSFPTARAEVLDRCIAICEHRLGEVEDSSAELEAGRALLGLALAYRSSEHSRASQQYEAEWLMERALANLDAPEGESAPTLDPLRREILARVLELRADHFASHGDHAKCRQILEEIGPLLAECEMPGLDHNLQWREAKLHCLSAVCLALEEVHLGAAFAALKVMALRNLLSVEDALKLLEVVPIPSHEKYWARLLLEAAER